MLVANLATCSHDNFPWANGISGIKSQTVILILPFKDAFLSVPYCQVAGKKNLIIRALLLLLHVTVVNRYLFCICYVARIVPAFGIYQRIKQKITAL